MIVTTVAAPKIATNNRSPCTAARPQPSAASAASAASSRTGSIYRILFISQLFGGAPTRHVGSPTGRGFGHDLLGGWSFGTNAAACRLVRCIRGTRVCHQRWTLVYGERTRPDSARRKQRNRPSRAHMKVAGHWMLLARLESLVAAEKIAKKPSKKTDGPTALFGTCRYTEGKRKPRADRG
jgi:hypothetical protein